MVDRADMDYIKNMAKDVCHLDRNCDECNIAYECKAIDYATRFYDANYRKQEWISVEERLPEECGMPVLMVAVNRYSQTMVVKGFTDYQCPITFHTNEREFDGVWGAWDVTHWMPLPMPPKGDEGK